jgi:purine nucleosidase
MRLIIDTDTGVDDAEALIMALTHPNATVEAITTVTGNVHLDNVNPNVALVLQLVGCSVPIYSGAIQPLVEKWNDDGRRFHGDDGLGDWSERPPCELKLETEHAAVALVRLATEFPGELTLIALGPLTNIALAIRLDPTFPQKIKQFVFMGGTIAAHGNTPTVTAEFNIFIDPEAAFITLEAFPYSTMLSWETTIHHVIEWAEHDRFCNLNTPLAQFYAGMNSKNDHRLRPVYKGHLLPDPLAMAITLQPELILEQETRHVTVELRGQYTRGQTVVNYTRYTTGKANVSIVRRVNMNGVLQLYENMLCSTINQP